MVGAEHEPIRQEAMARLGQAISFLDELYERWLDGDLTDTQNEALSKVRDQIVLSKVALGVIDLKEKG